MKVLATITLLMGILAFLYVEKIESGGLQNLPDSPALVRHFKGEELTQPFGIVLCQKYSLVIIALSLSLILIPKDSKKKQ